MPCGKALFWLLSRTIPRSPDSRIRTLPALGNPAPGNAATKWANENSHRADAQEPEGEAVSSHILRITPERMPMGSDFFLNVYGSGFITGEQIIITTLTGSVSLTTVVFDAYTLSAELTPTLVAISQVCTITTTHSDNSAEFTWFNGLPESPHPYDLGVFSLSANVCVCGSSRSGNLWITFDAQTYVYRDPDPTYNDSIVINWNDLITGSPESLTFHGSDLAGMTVNIAASSGFTVTIPNLFGGNFFGYRIVDIRSTAPEATGFYRLGNRNAEDLLNPTAASGGFPALWPRSTAITSLSPTTTCSRKCCRSPMPAHLTATNSSFQMRAR